MGGADVVHFIHFYLLHPFFKPHDHSQLGGNKIGDNLNYFNSSFPLSISLQDLLNSQGVIASSRKPNSNELTKKKTPTTAPPLGMS